MHHLAKYSFLVVLPKNASNIPLTIRKAEASVSTAVCAQEELKFAE